MSSDEVDKVFDLLREDEGWMPILWNPEVRANLAKLVSGDIYQVTEVVRNLSLRKRGKDFSRRMEKGLS